MDYAIASENKKEAICGRESRKMCKTSHTKAELTPQETSHFSQERFPVKTRWSEDSTQTFSGTEVNGKYGHQYKSEKLNLKLFLSSF